MVDRAEVERVVGEALQGLARWGPLRAYRWRLRAVDAIMRRLNPFEARAELLELGLGNPVAYPLLAGEARGTPAWTLSYDYRRRLTGLALAGSGVAPWRFVVTYSVGDTCAEELAPGYAAGAASWTLGMVLRDRSAVEAVLLFDRCGAVGALLPDPDVAGLWYAAAVRYDPQYRMFVAAYRLDPETVRSVCGPRELDKLPCVLPRVEAKLNNTTYLWDVYEVRPGTRGDLLWPVDIHAAVKDTSNLYAWYHYTPFMGRVEEVEGGG